MVKAVRIVGSGIPRWALDVVKDGTHDGKVYLVAHTDVSYIRTTSNRQFDIGICNFNPGYRIGDLVRIKEHFVGIPAGVYPIKYVKMISGEEYYGIRQFPGRWFGQDDYFLHKASELEHVGCDWTGALTNESPKDDNVLATSALASETVKLKADNAILRADNAILRADKRALEFAQVQSNATIRGLESEIDYADMVMTNQLEIIDSILDDRDTLACEVVCGRACALKLSVYEQLIKDRISAMIMLIAGLLMLGAILLRIGPGC